MAPERVFKTLVAEVDGALTVAVVPVTGELDLKALAAAVGGKRAALADRAAAERGTGYVAAASARSGSATAAHGVDDSALDLPTDLRLGRPARSAARTGPGRPDGADRRRAPRRLQTH